jgi:hypothetical protein
VRIFALFGRPSFLRAFHGWCVWGWLVLWITPPWTGWIHDVAYAPVAGGARARELIGAPGSSGGGPTGGTPGVTLETPLESAPSGPAAVLTGNVRRPRAPHPGHLTTATAPERLVPLSGRGRRRGPDAPGADRGRADRHCPGAGTHPHRGVTTRRPRPAVGRTMLVTAVPDDSPETLTRNSPLGRALARAQPGGTITYPGPNGMITAEVIAIQPPRP